MGGKRGRLSRWFSRVGGGVMRTGEVVSKARDLARLGPPKEDEMTRRLRELKELELRVEEERREAERESRERRLREERKEELRKPLSERLSQTFYGPLRHPAERLMGFFKGIDQDLYRANLPLSPERYVSLVLGVSILVALFSFLFSFLLFSTFLALLVAPLSFLFSFTFGRIYPRSRVKSRAVAINREMPYALRHMATHLSSGIGLPESVTSVSKANYGVLSEEFGRVVRDMNGGMSMEEALTSLAQRVESEPLKRFVRQVVRTLRVGGDLSHLLNSLADETSFEMRMKLRDYTQSLNMLTLIYMFASSVVPALLIIMTTVTSGMGGAAMSTQSAAVLFLLLVPFLLVVFLFMVKRFEPRL
ncbi:MAG: type II secretion system F family protein [Candidatus Hadarchaeales archaeon]